MIAVFTGNGKGKTTAALGQAVRIVGRGKRVLMIQFIKGPWASGEDFAEIRKRANEKNKSQPFDAALGEARFELRKRGLGFVGILGDKLPREDHKNAAEKALNECRIELESGKWDALILDEVNVAIHLGLLDVGAVLGFLNLHKPETVVICTGRNAPQELVDTADIVTEMREVKHPFKEGKLGKPLVEF